jgi:L-arabinonolactonase
MASQGLMKEAVMHIETLPTGRDMLGESPVWDERIQALYWADQLGQKVRRFSPITGIIHEWATPDKIGCIGLGEDESLMLALADGFYRLDLITGACKMFAAARQSRPGIRLNDGRCDRSGRLIVGSAVTDEGDPDGVLYRLSGDGRLEVLERGLMLPNAVCFNPPGDQMYSVDSRAGIIMVRDYDPHGDHVGEPREFVDARPYGIAPDGASVDEEGGLWVAQIVSGQILHFLSDGSFDRSLKLPAPYLSSVCFGGPNLDVLYVTSVSDTKMRIKTDHPMAGAVFAVSGLGVRGVAEGRFGRAATVMPGL